MTARMILLDAKPLGVADVAEIARRNARLILGEEAMRRIRASRALIEHLTGLGKPMYGGRRGCIAGLLHLPGANCAQAWGSGR